MLSYQAVSSAVAGQRSVHQSCQPLSMNTQTNCLHSQIDTVGHLHTRCTNGMWKNSQKLWKLKRDADLLRMYITVIYVNNSDVQNLTYLTLTTIPCRDAEYQRSYSNTATRRSQAA